MTEQPLRGIELNLSAEFPYKNLRTSPHHSKYSIITNSMRHKSYRTVIAVGGETNE